MKLSTTMVAAVLVIVVSASYAPAAQRPGIVGQFPDVAQVEMDYPDDAERYIAYDALFNRLNEVTRGNTPGAYQLASAYLSARGQIQVKYDAQPGGSAEFLTRSRTLFQDPMFRRSVFERYGVLDLPAPGGSTSGGFVLFPERPGDRSDEEIKAAFFEAFPVWGGTLLGMFGLMWFLMRSDGEETVKTAPQPESPYGLPPFPESLRCVSVAGRRYEVTLVSGKVTALGLGSGVAVLHLRTPDGQEVPLALGPTFGAGPANIVSAVGRPLPNGDGDVLLAYNHTTDQLDVLPGLYRVHATRFLRPLILVGLAATIPGAFGLGILFHRLGGMPPASLPIALATLLIMAAVPSTIIAAFMAVRLKIRVETNRNKRFASEYLQDYRSFFQSSTAPLTRHFASP